MNEKKRDGFVRWLSELSKDDVVLVGGKGANLAEMYNLGLPVPPAFVVTSEAYSYFLEQTGLAEEIYEKLKDLDEEDTSKLEKTAKELREKIKSKEMPDELREEINEAYENLSVDKEELEKAGKDVVEILNKSDLVFVAARSSATAEDSSTASFAGQQETILNIKGKSNLIEAVKKCFASLFTARSIFYRIKKKIKHKDILNAVVVQKMIDSDKSGVIFSKDPVEKSDNIVIEAVFGLGEGIVSGKIKPDHYVVSRAGPGHLKIIKKEIADKKLAVVRDSGGNQKDVELTREKSLQQVLSEHELLKLANYAVELEEHYGVGQDIEFGIEGREIYILQTRPITTLETREEKKKEEVGKKVLLSGLAASPGIASGKVKIVKSLDDLNKIKEGDVLVTKMTNPDMVVTMQKSAAIVTDEGGITAHAAIVSREMGIPAVVGTDKATKILEEGQEVTVDGFSGKIYEGVIERKKEAEEEIQKFEIKPKVETRTNIKVIVDLPRFAERAAKSGCKEVGLTRIEGIIAENGKHPNWYLKENKIRAYEDMIYSGIEKISEYFDRIWVRTSDIRSDEYSNLEGSKKEEEANPMLGMHGIREGLKNPEILKAELRALGRIKKEVGILLPQVISVDEVKKVKEILNELDSEIKLGVMIETPASVEIIEELCDAGIQFISFGTNDLTQYTLAVDRGNEEVQYLYDEMHPAVLSQIKRVIKVCKEKNVETSICGQAGSRKEMVEFLVKEGIDSISVNADAAYDISLFVRDLEEQIEVGVGGGFKGVTKEIQREPAEGIESKNIKRDKFGRKVYSIVCDECGKDAEVPFKPKDGRKVYCKNCYRNMKKKRKKSEREAEEEFLTEEKNQEAAEIVKKNIEEIQAIEEFKDEEADKGETDSNEDLEEEWEEAAEEIENEEKKEMGEVGGDEVLDIF